MEKYNQLKDQLRDGDIVLFRGSKFLARAIQWADDAYYNHCGVVWNIGDRLMTIDAVAEGIGVVPLRRRMNEYLDFCVVRKTNMTEDERKRALVWAISKVEKHTSYDKAMLLRFL